VFEDESAACSYSVATLEKIWNRKPGEITNVEFPLGLKPIKVNTMLSFDGFRACITGKASGGTQIGLSSMMPLVIGRAQELYVKRLESYAAKKEKNKKITLNEEYDGISAEDNENLYKVLMNKVVEGPYRIPFSAQVEVLSSGYDRFRELDREEQVNALLAIVLMLKSGRAGTCDLSYIGGSKNAGAYTVSSKANNWLKSFSDVRIIRSSASGIYETRSDNLLELL